MKRLWAALLLMAAPALALEVPSGQPVALQEVLLDQVGEEVWLRFRFVAPEVSREADYEIAEADMAHLCAVLALPYMAEYELNGDVIVISLANQETEFGVAEPDATQFFEAYRIQDDACIWEGF